MSTIFEQFKRRSSELPYRNGVGVVAINSEGKVFVGETRGFIDIWKMPQGGVEQGENLEDAGYRELFEETDLIGEEILKTSQKDYSYDFPATGRNYMPGFQGQKFTWLMIRVDETDEVNLISNTPINEDIEFSKHKWVSPQEAIELAHNEYSGDPVTYQRQQMYKQVFAEFGCLDMNQSQKPEISAP